MHKHMHAYKSAHMVCALYMDTRACTETIILGEEQF